MTPEKLPRSGLIAGMTAKQKITMGALLFIVILIIWQVKGMFSESSIQPAPVPASKAKPQQSSRMVAEGPEASDKNEEQQTESQGQITLREAPVRIEPEVLDVQKRTEQEFIEQLNQLQMLKVQKEIAEANQAIASARLATVTAEKSVSDLLTKPTFVATPQPEIPASAYSATLANPSQPVAVPSEAPPAEIAPPKDTAYIVISVAMQLGRWSAVLGNEGKLYNVSVGDILPTDGSRVVSINKNVVILEKDGERRRISVTSSI